jgi:hypothetical protein
MSPVSPLFTAGFNLILQRPLNWGVFKRKPAPTWDGDQFASRKRAKSRTQSPVSILETGLWGASL